MRLPACRVSLPIDIPVERTIAEIQKILAQNGARGIAIEYDEGGTVKVIFFKIKLDNQELPFRLPAKAERVYQALWLRIGGVSISC